ncbi:transmembrane proteins 14C-domain-containing protein [Cokeromyces recurvatus]|uniref:transmembrane proteins 14C-domain-containing protein n=1 Tax=Cokeromyces recurvatus TaxID=90255 RepID=UPI00222019A8|nr:transmembrane proteins 14C-domain-containing protein [Cokeromyces recurvatus]KAI7906653.1 transmembrane proteins 14C-domain-containing protein [Cokeromyces recurvatus]
MSHHTSYTLAGLCAAGGIAGFARTRSIPSLVAGLGVGILYGTAGYLIQQNKDYGHETAVAASTILGGAMIPRALKTRKPVPVALSVISIAAGSYYVKKIIDYS